MILIDAGTLRKQIDNEYAHGLLTSQRLYGIIDAAPTVRCEECKHEEQCGHYVEFACHFAAVTGCSAFERRTP